VKSEGVIAQFRVTIYSLNSNSTGKTQDMTSSPFIFDTVINECGGITGVAEHFGITRSAVQQWKIHGIPANRVLSLVALGDHKMSPSDIRPDIFGNP
jgi:hypothetical protein